MDLDEEELLCRHALLSVRGDHDVHLIIWSATRLCSAAKPFWVFRGSAAPEPTGSINCSRRRIIHVMPRTEKKGPKISRSLRQVSRRIN
jgi:hypothetical protein